MTMPKPNPYKTPKQVARAYLDEEYEGLSITEVAAIERIPSSSLSNAIKREQEKRIKDEVEL